MRAAVPAISGYPTPNRVWCKSSEGKRAASLRKRNAFLVTQTASLRARAALTREESPQMSPLHFVSGVMGAPEACSVVAASPRSCHFLLAADELPFVPSVVAVITWFAVGRYSAKNDLLNTFQAVLASDPGASLGWRSCEGAVILLRSIGDTSRSSIIDLVPGISLADAGRSFVILCFVRTTSSSVGSVVNSRCPPSTSLGQLKF